MYVRGYSQVDSPTPIRIGATCVVPKRLTVRKLRCDAGDLGPIGAVVKRAVTAAEVRGAIGAGAELAVTWLVSAADALKRPRPKAAAGEPMRLNFRDAFGTAPEFVPSWRQGGAKWDRGDVVRKRLLCAAKIVAGGFIEYVCWGPRSCPYPYAWRPTTWAVVQAGRYRICLGEAFWRAWKDGNTNDLAATLLHECLHIYFPTVRDTRDRGAFGFAACYERFVQLMNGIPLSDYVKETCRTGLPAGDYPPPRPDRAYA